MGRYVVIRMFHISTYFRSTHAGGKSKHKQDFFPTRLPTRGIEQINSTHFFPMRSACPSLAFIITLWSCSLCSFLKTPITSPFTTQSNLRQPLLIPGSTRRKNADGHISPTWIRTHDLSRTVKYYRFKLCGHCDIPYGFSLEMLTKIFPVNALN